MLPAQIRIEVAPITVLYQYNPTEPAEQTTQPEQPTSNPSQPHSISTTNLVQDRSALSHFMYYLPIYPTEGGRHLVVSADVTRQADGS